MGNLPRDISESTTAEWRVLLEGEAFDLEDLPALTLGCTIEVLMDEDGTYFLRSPELRTELGSEEIRGRAAALVRSVNGVGRLRRPDHRPVRPHALAYAHESGERQVFSWESAEMRFKGSVVSMKVTHRDGTDEYLDVDVEPATAWLKASRDPDVTEVLGLLSTFPLDWMSLFKIFEIIRPEALAAGWCSKAESSSFRAGANRPEVSGESARHARMGGDPPARWMTLEEGRAFIVELVRLWLDTRAIS